MILTPGSSATICRVASMPFKSGIATSMMITSGSSSRASPLDHPAILGFSQHLDVVLLLQHGPEPLSHDLVIVGNQNLDAHASTPFI